MVWGEGEAGGGRGSRSYAQAMENRCVFLGATLARATDGPIPAYVLGPWGHVAPMESTVTKSAVLNAFIGAAKAGESRARNQSELRTSRRLRLSRGQEAGDSEPAYLMHTQAPACTCGRAQGRAGMSLTATFPRNRTQCMNVY